MKPQRLQSFIPLRGVNEVLNPQLGDANLIANCAYDHRGGWRAGYGIESWWKFPDNIKIDSEVFDTYLNSNVDACYQWKRQGTNDVYTFVEQGGVLYYMLGNKGTGATLPFASDYFNDIVVVDDNRNIPKLSEVGSQFINLGAHLLIINGEDRAILFSGDRVWRDFGYTLPTSTPDVFDVDPQYMQGLGQLTGGTAIWFDEGVLGMGDNTGEIINEYAYKVTYISDLGAESPLSEAGTCNWQIKSATSLGQYKYGIMLDVPAGPEGTIARRIYRTKNITTNGEIYYFITQIDENSSRRYVDILPDSYLTSTAPPIQNSSVISSDFNRGEVWDNRLWLSKGNKIIYSDRGIFEQFGSLNFFDVGNLKGGDITQIRAFYNNLIVFRESAINIISVLDNGAYTMSTVTEDVGTKSPNGVVLIPQIGVAFMNSEGAWILTGGLNGGASLRLQKISMNIDEKIKLVNLSLQNKIIGAYSSATKELWFHFVEHNNTIPNFGIVYHLEPEIPQWSYRGWPDGDEYASWSAMTTTIDGHFLLGTSSQWTDGFDILSKTTMLGPLQVLSYDNTWGQSGEVSANVDGILTIDVNKNGHPGWSWESEWYTLNNNSAMQRIYSVELELMSYGDNAFDFYYSTDYSFEEQGTTGQKQAKSSTVFTRKEDPVMGPADNTITKVPFTIGTSRVISGRLIKLRYDVNTELCDQFKFGIKSSNLFHLVSFNLLMDMQAVPVLNQSTRIQRGQAR